MAKLPDNCYKRDHGLYVAHDADGLAWRCSREGRRWHARPSHARKDEDKRYLSAPTLIALCAKIKLSKEWIGK